MKTPASSTGATRKKNLKAPALRAVEAGRLDEPHQPAASPMIPRDDLVDIEGIDPRIEMALNSIGIRRFTDFAGYTPHSLAQTLEEQAGISISSDTIAAGDWFGWAQILAEESATRRASQKNPDPVVDETHEAIVPKHTGEEVSNAGEKKAQEANNSNASVAFDDNKPIEEPTIRPVKKTLHIKAARFVPQPTKPSVGIASKKLRCDVTCELIWPKEAATLDSATLCAQVHAVNLATGVYELLGSTSRAVPLVHDDYDLVIDFHVPQVGRYQLQTVVMLLGAQPMIDCRQGPVLKVIP
jgi:predicted flap endonuclease-1-like 5' DNA nuclease